MTILRVVRYIAVSVQYTYFYVLHESAVVESLVQYIPYEPALNNAHREQMICIFNSRYNS